VSDGRGQAQVQEWKRPALLVQFGAALDDEPARLVEGAGRPVLLVDIDRQLAVQCLGVLDQPTTGAGTTKFGYDQDNRQVTMTDALSEVTTTAYDLAGNVVARVDGLGHVTSYGYDALNRQVTVTDSLLNVVTTGYDAVGNVTRTVDQLGFATTTSYDALNRPVTIQDANGLISTVSYDANSNVIARVDGLGHATTYAFDALNRQVTVLDSRGFVTTTGYDAVGNTTLVVDSDGNRTTMSFDGDNRLTQQADPFNNLSTMAYDAASRLTSTTDRDGRRRDFQYDLDNRQTTVIWNVAGNPVNTLTYSFDGAGNMLTAGDINGTYTMTYDGLNRQVTVQGPFNTTLTLTCDAAGNRTLRQDSLGGTTSYSFDMLNRLATVQFGGASQTPLRVDLAYTARSQLATITRFSDLAGSTKIGSSAFSYDPGMRMTTMIHANSGGTPLATYAWSYDGANRLTTEKLNSNAPMTYSYDLTNQLTTVQSSYGTQTYGYDATGNRTNTGYQTTLANEVTSDGTWTYTFDSEGNLVKKSKGAGAETWTFGYDNLNHLVTAIDKSTDGGTTIAVATYTYDVFGDRLEADDWATGGTTTITRFAYDGQDVWADLTSGNALQTRYIRANQIDSLFARISAAGTAAWYLTDRLGSVRDLADNTGALQDHIDFDGFGKILSESNSTFGDRFKFTGREWDPVDSLQYNRARYYDPATGRWTSQDPLGLKAGDSNLYRYLFNNAPNRLDPFGLADRSWISVRLSVRVLFDSGPDRSAGDISKANDIWKQACIRFQKVGPTDFWSKQKTEAAIGEDHIVNTVDPPRPFPMPAFSPEVSALRLPNELRDRVYVLYVKGIETRFAEHPGLPSVYGRPAGLTVFDVPHVILAEKAFQSVLAHELGHALGLGHVADTENLMNYVYETYGKRSRNLLLPGQEDVARARAQELNKGIPGFP
jgi:RHS repeat-associated protein